MTNDLFGRKLALSIRQPWATLIVRGLKDVENRKWRTNYRGPVLIHASKTIDVNAVDRFNIPWTELPTGGIVGVAEIVDCVSSHDSEWFEGPFGFVLANARPLPFMPMAGTLGLFDVTEHVERFHSESSA